MKFINGPANGIEIPVGRTPILLRVVRGTTWDVLDQLKDSPREDEEVFVYKLASRPTVCFIDHADRRKSGMQYLGSYEYYEPQPRLLTNEDWNLWCDSVRDQVIAEMKQKGIIP